jgi:dipeptidyl aminopeptidase/acylaminoacyl peptidase
MSFGAIETNYIITKTNIFAAACSASGLSNFISGYGSLAERGVSLQYNYERGQNRIGVSLWENQGLYIRNSPVLFADKVNVPLLMMHTTNDGICPFSNAIEFFTALRRLKKKVWMLEYNGNHGVHGSSALDFTIRMTQFFDFYLKDKPPGIWMTEGVPAVKKSINSGLSLDHSGKMP